MPPDVLKQGRHMPPTPLTEYASYRIQKSIFLPQKKALIKGYRGQMPT